MKIRVGIIGLGDDWESLHQPALRALSDRYDIRAVYCKVAQKAARAADGFKACQVHGFRALINRPDIDAVLMLAPEWYGPLPILAACEAGKAIYCSTSLDIDPGEARDIKQRVDESGVAFMAEFPRRHAPATLRLKELIATRLGTPRLIFCHENVKPLGNGHASRNHLPRSSDVSQQSRLMMELVDWCCYVADAQPTSVVSVGHQAAATSPEHDFDMMSLDFSPPGQPGGAIAQISCDNYMPANWPGASGFRPPAGLKVCCERGVAFVDLPSQLIWYDAAGQHLESLDSDRPVGEQLLTQFYRAVTSLVRKTSDLEDAYRALHIVLTAQTSYREGRKIEL